MANGKAVAEGIVYLADKFARGDKDGIHVDVSDQDERVLHLYLVEDKTKLFADTDVDFMKTLGFDYWEFQDEYYGNDTYEELPYSCFYIDA